MEKNPDPDRERSEKLDSWLDGYDRAIEDLERDIRHDCGRRHCLIDDVQKFFRKRDVDRAAFLSAQLENERSIRSLRDELAAARQDNSHFREELAALRTQTERLESERKNLLEILERGGYLHRRKRPRTDGRAETSNVKRRMRSHPTRQLNGVCIALAVQHTKWADELG